jgi:prepilin-type processing-associated H-X9-DG protein
VVNGGRENYTGPDRWNFDWIDNGVFIDKGMARPPQGDSAFKITSSVLDSRHTLSTVSKNDGVSMTIMIAENSAPLDWRTAETEQEAQVLWFADNPIPLNENVRVNRADFLADRRYGRPSSWHPGGFNVAYCDGRIVFMSDDIDYQLYARLMTSNGKRAQDPDPANPGYPNPVGRTNPSPRSRNPVDEGFTAGHTLGTYPLLVRFARAGGCCASCR